MAKINKKKYYLETSKQLEKHEDQKFVIDEEHTKLFKKMPLHPKRHHHQYDGTEGNHLGNRRACKQKLLYTNIDAINTFYIQCPRPISISMRTIKNDDQVKILKNQTKLL
jgi:hypothetical protein